MHRFFATLIVSASVLAGATKAGATTLAANGDFSIWGPNTDGSTSLGHIDLDTDLGGDFALDHIAADEVAPQPPTRAVVPEPATIALVGVGFLAAAVALRRRRRV